MENIYSPNFTPKGKWIALHVYIQNTFMFMSYTSNYIHIYLIYTYAYNGTLKSVFIVKIKRSLRFWLKQRLHWKCSRWFGVFFFFLRCKEIGIKSWKIWNWNGITEKRALGFRVRILDYSVCTIKKRNILG